MSTAAKWTLVGAIAVLVLGLLVFARGAEHHRGDEIGTAGNRPSVSTGPTAGSDDARQL